jgi:hypothetical protein
VVIFSAVERYPISINFSQNQANSIKVLGFKKEAGFSTPFFVRVYDKIIGIIEIQFGQDMVAHSPFRKGVLMFLDFDNFYNVSFIVIANSPPSSHSLD